MNIEKNSIQEILKKMNSGNFDLDQFFEAIEIETGGKLTFTSFKSFLDKHYDNINKCILYIFYNFKFYQ